MAGTPEEVFPICSSAAFFWPGVRKMHRYVHVLKVFRSDILSEKATWEGCELELDSERTSVPFLFLTSNRKSCQHLANGPLVFHVRYRRAEQKGKHSAAKGKDDSSMGAIRIDQVQKREEFESEKQKN